jgi:hypothetical protein
VELVGNRVSRLLKQQLPMRRFWQGALWAPAFCGVLAGFMAILGLAYQLQTELGLPLIDVGIILVTPIVVEWKLEGKRRNPNPLD